MPNLVTRAAIATSMAIGAGALGLSPALAAAPTSATVSGQAQVYPLTTTETSPGSGIFLLGGPDAPTASNVLGVLTDGDSTLAKPGGNVELGKFYSSPRTTLTTTFAGGVSAAFTSLLESDFFPGGDMNYYAPGDPNETLATKYFNSLIDANKGKPENSGFVPALDNPGNRAAAFEVFKSAGYFSRASDPNIAFVDVEDLGGGAKELNYGLAGFFNLLDLLPAAQASILKTSGINLIQGSEVVKVDFTTPNGSVSKFDWDPGILVEKSNVVGPDGKSFDATYDPGAIVIPGKPQPPTGVPEPSVLLGLAALAGLAVKARKQTLA